VYGFVYFALLDTRVPWLVGMAIVLSLLPHDIMYGPQAALIAESFPGRLRYSGASLGYQLSSLIAGGPAPLIASSLIAHYHSAWPIAIFIFACAIVSLIATALLKDNTNQDI
jgi:MFS family permease